MKLPVAEVVLIRMQFHQAAGSKIRPALVLLDPGDEDFVAAPITSQPRASEFDFGRRGLADGWSQCPLDGASANLPFWPKLILFAGLESVQAPIGKR